MMGCPHVMGHGWSPRDGLSPRNGLSPRDGLSPRYGLSPRDGLSPRESPVSTFVSKYLLFAMVVCSEFGIIGKTLCHNNWVNRDLYQCSLYTTITSIFSYIVNGYIVNG